MKGRLISQQAAARIAKRLERQQQDRIARTRYLREQIARGEANEIAGIPHIGEALNQQIADNEKQHREIYRERTHTIRKEARAIHLAYGFARGVPFKAMEQKSWSPPEWGSIERHVRASHNESEYGTVLQQFAEWRDAAGRWEQPPAKPAKYRASNWVQRTVTAFGPPDPARPLSIDWLRPRKSA